MRKNLRKVLSGCILLVGLSAQGQYCVPSTGSHGCDNGDFIASVNLDSISNSTGCNGPLANYTAMSTTVYTDSVYHAYIGLNPDFNQGIGIFIDWNHDFDFNDPGEFYSNGNVTPYSGVENIAITVPTGALPGPTRMRVGCQYANVMQQNNACATIGNYGEYEEYTLNVKQTLPYSNSITDNGSNASILLEDFSTCQDSVFLISNCITDNGTAWVDGSYSVYADVSTLVGTYTGSQRINLSAYIPLTSVTVVSNETGMATVSGTVAIITNGTSNPNPGPLVTDTSYCIGATPVQLSAAMQGNGTSLKWYTGGNGFGQFSVTAPTPSTAVPDTADYWVSQLDGSGCESLRSKIRVIVHDLPAAPTLTNQDFCYGLVGDLVPTAGSSVRWYDDSLSTTPLADTVSLMAANYYADTVDMYGCVSVKTGMSVSLLNNTGSETASACDTFTWVSNGMTYYASGSYLDTLTNAAGCDSVVTLNLTIYALPVPTIAANGDGTFTASGADSYQWYDCQTQTMIQGETSATFAPAANGSYYVEGTTTDGCSANSTCVNLTDLGLAEELATSISVYPNPTTGMIVVSIPESAAFTIMDTQGTEVLNGTVQQGDQIDLTSLAKGLYLIRFKVKGTLVTKRIVRG